MEHKLNKRKMFLEYHIYYIWSVSMLKSNMALLLWYEILQKNSQKSNSENMPSLKYKNVGKNRWKRLT